MFFRRRALVVYNYPSQKRLEETAAAAERTTARTEA